MTRDDAYITRIQSITRYHPQCHWQFGYDSDDDAWSLSIVLPYDDDEADVDAQIHKSPMGLNIRVAPAQNAPAFAMRCQSLAVIAEALEHWQAHLLTKDDA